MATSISNSEDVIDSLDVIARIEELEDERQSLVDDVDNAKQTLGDARDDTSALGESEVDDAREDLDKAEGALADWDTDNGEEYAALTALAHEAEGYSEDWTYGATLVNDEHFTEYAKQLCEDIGDLPRGFPSYIEIDWEKTAENIKVDYTSVNFDGVTYWIR